MTQRDMDTNQVDQLVVLLDDIAAKTHASSDRLAQHRQACSRHLELVRQKPAPNPELDAAVSGADELHQARALRNLSKKMFTESQRLLQYVQLARQAQTKLAARQTLAHQQQEALKQRQAAERPVPPQQPLIAAARSSSCRLASPARPRHQPALGGGPTISPVRPHEHQQLEQLALLVEQKAQLTLQLELRDQKIAYQEAHISLLERELNARYDGSITGSEDLED